MARGPLHLGFLTSTHTRPITTYLSRPYSYQYSPERDDDLGGAFKRPLLYRPASAAS
ncbi:hypothetical protein EVJ58_g6293 [Rhodofomes roseus]|uniref:Uncharacterized protein n=1 Tax=Rhodofomes roseus TaxID=34475 RepID=A0A4Y9Y7Z6_9APHY|nr:hypothetical protein EVJ58_g6293 [Rhodofomes roseus]